MYNTTLVECRAARCSEVRPHLACRDLMQALPLACLVYEERFLPENELTNAEPML